MNTHRQQILIIGTGRWARIYHNNLLCSPLSQAYRINCIKSSHYLDIDQNLGNSRSFPHVQLSIIANSTKDHYLTAIAALDHSKLILIEKPCFYMASEYKLFDKYLKYKNVCFDSVFVSCPFLFSGLADVAKSKLKGHKPQILHVTWNDNIDENIHKTTDKSVQQTALTHILPIITYILDLDPSKCTFNLSNSSPKTTELCIEGLSTSITVTHTLTRDPKSRKISIIDPFSSFHIDFSNNALSADSSNIFLSKRLPYSPLSAQVLDILNHHVNGKHCLPTMRRWCSYQFTRNNHHLFC
jgi:hypothetical protein